MTLLGKNHLSNFILEEAMSNKELFGVPVVTILRYLALVVVLIGLAYTGTYAVTAAGWQAIGANVFHGLLLTLFFSSILYGISYIIQAAGDTVVIWGIKISSLLRYFAIIATIIGLLFAIFSGLAASADAEAGWKVTSNILYGLLLTIALAAILYAVSSVFGDTDKEPKKKAETKPKAKPTATPTVEE